MRKYKETVNTTKTMVLDGHVVCDLCKTNIIHERYSADQVEINMRKGFNYPENGSGTDTGYDVCATCFVDKIVPWFKTQGAEEPTVRNWNW